MSLLLPKGVIKNSPEIEGSIGRIDAEPLDPADIARFWKVYTTTKRRLLDPTAERLENYWWRIWGSPKRELKGATVARLFAQISDGHAFVPLRGPPNRDEGSPPLERNTRFRPGASSATTLHRPVQSRPSTTSSSALSRTPTVMPHPILKKTRGPSTTGPRPTARFISPHESEKEGEPDSPVGTNSHVVVQPPSPDPENTKADKKSSGSAGAKKKSSFVASSSAKKKRPVIVRRQSSQSSTDSPNPPGSIQPTMQRTSPSSSTSEQSKARGKQSVPSKFQENFSPSNRSHASTTRKDRSSKTSDSKRSSPRKVSVQRGQSSNSQDFPPEGTESGPSKRLHAVENGHNEVEELTSGELERVEVQRTLPEQANASTRKVPQVTPQVQPYPASTDRVRVQRNPPASIPSQKDGGEDAGGILSHKAKSATSLAPTLTTAIGHLDLENSAVNKSNVSSAPPSTASRKKGKGKSTDELQRGEMFTKRQVQPTTAAVSEPIGSLSRSRSQLTLLLEKDRARGSDNKSTNGKRR